MDSRIIPPAKYLTLLCHQVWASDTFLPSITEVPILFLSGLQDEIVPYVHPISSFAKPAKPNDDLISTHKT